MKTIVKLCLLSTIAINQTNLSAFSTRVKTNYTVGNFSIARYHDTFSNEVQCVLNVDPTNIGYGILIYTYLHTGVKRITNNIPTLVNGKDYNYKIDGKMNTITHVDLTYSYNGSKSMRRTHEQTEEFINLAKKGKYLQYRQKISYMEPYKVNLKGFTKAYELASVCDDKILSKYQ